MDEPTLGELHRLLSDMKAQLTAMSSAMPQTYVQRQVHDVQLQGVERRIVELHDEFDEKIVNIKAEQDKSLAWKRQVGLALAVVALGGLVSIALTITNLLAMG